MFSFTLFYADCLENPKNCYYTNKSVISINDTASLEKVVSHDYVAVEYKDNKRSNSAFIRSDCIILDCDNTHSENPNDWITPQHVANQFPNVAFAVHYSRNHLKSKNGTSPRQKFHPIFPITMTENAQDYSLLKEIILSAFPFFDSAAKDNGHMFYGTQLVKVEFFGGSLKIDDFIKNQIKAPTKEDSNSLQIFNDKNIIPEGQRNSTLYTSACKLLTRFGDSENARRSFYEISQQCSPQLPQQEVQQIFANALNFYNNKVAKRSDYVPPALFNNILMPFNGIPDLRMMPILEPSDFSDVGQAKLFAEHYKNQLRYLEADNNFIVFNGEFWEESETMARDLVHAFTERQLEEAETRETAITEKIKEVNRTQHLQAAENDDDGNGETNKQLQNLKADLSKAQAFYSFALKYRNSSRISATMTETMPMLAITLDKLDSDPFLLNTPDGTYDLRYGTEKKHEHDSSDFITKQTSVSPSDKGMDIWLDFLRTVFQNDHALMKFVQQIAGLGAIGQVAVESLFICVGSGKNGKSTMWNAIKNVMGTYAGTMSCDVLIADTKRNIKPELADLRGKRLVIASELGENDTLNTSLLKQIASTDNIKAEKKYGHPFEFKPVHTVILHTNYLPKVLSDAYNNGTWRRLTVIPFNAVIENSKDKKNYGEYLIEHAGQAILKWVIQGAQDIIARDFNLEIPPAIEEKAREYREDNDWLKNFIDERCEVGDDFKSPSGKFNSAYNDFADSNGEPRKSAGVINKALKEAGYVKVSTRSGVFIKGLRLRD